MGKIQLSDPIITFGYGFELQIAQNDLEIASRRLNRQFFLPDDIVVIGLVFIHRDTTQTGGLGYLKAVEEKLDIPEDVFIVDDVLRPVKTLFRLIHCRPPGTQTLTHSSHRPAKARHQHPIR
jgi:hypothetical protein